MVKAGFVEAVASDLGLEGWVRGDGAGGGFKRKDRATEGH